MQILIDKDRDNFNNKLKEEHDQRRIEQMELVQRLDNNERCGKSDITVCIVVSLFEIVPTVTYYALVKDLKTAALIGLMFKSLRTSIKVSLNVQLFATIIIR